MTLLATPDTHPPLRLGGTTRAEQVLTAWQADRELVNKEPVKRGVALGQRPIDIERRLTGNKAVVNEGYADAARARAEHDVNAKAAAKRALEEAFADGDELARKLETARINANGIVAPLASFFEGHSRDRRTGQRGAAQARRYRLLPPQKLSPSSSFTALALSKDLELEEIERDIAMVENSVVPLADAKKKMLRELDELAAKGALHVRRVGPFRGSLAWPETNVAAQPLSEGFKPRIVDTSALFIRHFRKQIEAEAIAELESFYGDVISMTPQERHDELRKLRAARRAVERVRIEATWKAIELGEPGDIWHRADADPYLLLGIEKPI